MVERAVTCPHRTQNPRQLTHERPAKQPVLALPPSYSQGIPSDREQLVTRHGHRLDEAVSALQKAVRRSHVDDSLYWSFELMDDYGAYLWRRIRVIASEDIGLAEPGLQAELWALHECWRDARAQKKPWLGTERIFVVHAVLRLARARKSRIADHALAVHLHGDGEGLYREVPDHALDMHTRRGRQMGRGGEHFHSTAGLLADPETGEVTAEGAVDDPYLERARELEEDR